MKKCLILTVLMLLIFAVTAAADDIWEPAPPVIDPVSIPELFRWDRSYDSVRRSLSDYEDWGIGHCENESETVITYIGDDGDENFTCSFLFTEDTRRLREIRTLTVCPAGNSAPDALESIRKKLKMDKMEPYPDKQLEAHARSEFEGYSIAADADTIYYGAYGRGSSSSGRTLFFAFIDRFYYEQQTR